MGPAGSSGPASRGGARQPAARQARPAAISSCRPQPGRRRGDVGSSTGRLLSGEAQASLRLGSRCRATAVVTQGGRTRRKFAFRYGGNSRL